MKHFVGGFAWGALATMILCSLACYQLMEDASSENKQLSAKLFYYRTMSKLMREGKTFKEAQAEFLQLFGHNKVEEQPDNN